MNNTIANLRLEAQHIRQADFSSPQTVVSWMGAMQAQDYAGALWAIGLRTQNLTQSDIEAAIKQGDIVRTWPMRGTLHFVVAENIRWMVDLMGPRASQKAASARAKLGITEQEIMKTKDILAKELGGKKYRSRPDVMALLEADGIPTGGQRGLHILGYLAGHGYLCLGPHIGKQPSFALLDEWVKKTPELTRDESLQKLATIYFKSHGPATENDFAAWTGLTLTDVRRALELSSSELATMTISGTTYWLDPALKQPAEDTLYLLPGFDEYMLGYRDRSAALAPEYNARIVPGGNGMFLATIVSCGQVIGTWRKTVKKQKVIIEAIAFTSFSARDRQLIEEKAINFGDFIGLPAEVIFSE